VRATRQRLGGICTQQTPGRQERIGEGNCRQILPDANPGPGAPGLLSGTPTTVEACRTPDEPPCSVRLRAS